MEDIRFGIESKKPFSESLIWQLNRDFYQEKGIRAWSEGIVPHQMTSNSKVGKTYAELIFAVLKDLGSKGKDNEVVYILELGAGHGRLAFHILIHLQKLVKSISEKIPRFCYVLSDIVEDNLAFFSKHPQLQKFFQEGTLDISYFDAIENEKIYLRNAKKTIAPQDLNQPIIAIANYFFDSIPNELFFIKDQIVSNCSVSIDSKENPQGMNTEDLIKYMEFSYYKSAANSPIYQEAILNEILEDYRNLLSNTYLFFPKQGINCLENLQAFSNVGLVLLTMDKGFHELDNLKNKKEPEIITHGSFSLWVNYHALSSYCEKQGGKTFFPSFSNFHLEIGCLLFLKDSDTYLHTDAAYQQVVNDFGPDDFNSLKKLAYFNVSRLKLIELIALFRLNGYDSLFFIKLLPRLKQVIQSITVNERKRLAQTMDCIWEMYFNINESYDLAYEIGGLLYDLGFYMEALNYFQYSVDTFGRKADIYYNQALCYYQLKQDNLFYKILDEAKKAFPDDKLIRNLDDLDMS